jgi:hypothetical protein
MSEPNLDILSSEIVLDLVSNGSFVKLFNKIYKTTDTDEPVEYIAKKVIRFFNNKYLTVRMERFFWIRIHPPPWTAMIA